MPIAFYRAKTRFQARGEAECLIGWRNGRYLVYYVENKNELGLITCLYKARNLNETVA
jgi:hypothetical protein